MFRGHSKKNLHEFSQVREALQICKSAQVINGWVDISWYDVFKKAKNYEKSKNHNKDKTLKISFVSRQLFTL